MSSHVENEMSNSPMPESKPNRYQALISRIFHDHFKNGMTEFEFERSELNSNAKKLKIKAAGQSRRRNLFVSLSGISS